MLYLQEHFLDAVRRVQIALPVDRLQVLKIHPCGEYLLIAVQDYRPDVVVLFQSGEDLRHFVQELEAENVYGLVAHRYDRDMALSGKFYKFHIFILFILSPTFSFIISKLRPLYICFEEGRSRLLRCACILSPRRPSRPPQHARCSKVRRTLSPHSRLLKVQVLPFPSHRKRRAIPSYFYGAADRT